MHKWKHLGTYEAVSDVEQKREDVRVNVHLPLQLRVSGYPAQDIRTRDLSGTGVGFATRLPVEMNQRASVTIMFDGWEFRSDVEIKFVKPIIAGVQVGAQFVDLVESDYERIVKIVFEYQQRSRAK